MFQGSCGAHVQCLTILGPASTRCTKRQAYNIGNDFHSFLALDETEQQLSLVLCRLGPSPILQGKLMYFHVLWLFLRADFSREMTLVFSLSLLQASLPSPHFPLSLLPNFPAPGLFPVLLWDSFPVSPALFVFLYLF